MILGADDRCTICARLLDNPIDPFSKDCGGDCLACMAYVGHDPDCMEAVRKLLQKGEKDAGS